MGAKREEGNLFIYSLNQRESLLCAWHRPGAGDAAVNTNPCPQGAHVLEQGA